MEGPLDVILFFFLVSRSMGGMLTFSFFFLFPLIGMMSLSAPHITDILSFQDPSLNLLSGIVNISGPPYLSSPSQAAAAPSEDQSPRSRPPVSGPKSDAISAALVQTTDVEAFQRAAISFVDGMSHKWSRSSDPECHDGGSQHWHLTKQIWIGDVILQPRHITLKAATRKQDPTAFFRAGERHHDDGSLACRIPLLYVYGSRDEIVYGENVLQILRDCWKDGERMEVLRIEDGDHIPWMTDSENFREGVLGWIGRHTQAVASNE
jgi:pimeloyl-ACP methyl ester carboxylesterase